MEGKAGDKDRQCAGALASLRKGRERDRRQGRTPEDVSVNARRVHLRKDRVAP